MKELWEIKCLYILTGTPAHLEIAHELSQSHYVSKSGCRKGRLFICLPPWFDWSAALGGGVLRGEDSGQGC